MTNGVEEEEKFPSLHEGIVQGKNGKYERSSANLLEEADFKKLLSFAKSVSRASGREQLTLEAFFVASVGEFQADISKELTDKIKILAKRWKLDLVANESEKNELTLPLSQDAKEFIGRHKKSDTHTFIADLLDNFQSELDGAHDDKDVGELEKLPKAAVVMLDEDQGATHLLVDSRFKILLKYTKLLAEKNNCDILTSEIMACACIYFHVDEMPLTKDQERFIKEYAKTNDINLLSLDLSKNIKKTFKVDDQLKSLLSHHKRDDFKIFYGQVLATFFSSCGNSSSDDTEEPDEENPSGPADKNNKSSIAPINSKRIKKSNEPEPAVYAPSFEEFFQCVDNFARYLKSETVTWEIMASASVFLGELKIKKQSADLLMQRIVENKFDLVNFDNSKSYGNYKLELESTLADFISGQENADFDSEFIPSLVSSFLGRSEKIQSLNASKKEKVTSLAASREKHVKVKKLAPEKPKSSRSRSRVAAYIGVICLILYSYNFYLGKQGSPENRVATSYSAPSTAPKVLSRKTARKPRTAQPLTDEELEKNAQSVTPEIASSPTVSTNAAVKPSFDCGISLTDIEKIICGNSELSSLDAQVTSFYRTARMAATYPKVILEEQRKWLLDRNACGTLSCLVASYRARRDYLAQWVKPNP